MTVLAAKDTVLVLSVDTTKLVMASYVGIICGG
jgi:hypothetical protein